MIITLVHAYSTTNSGDGLLVEEAAALAHDAFPDAQVSLVALDPSSFAPQDYAEILHPITGSDVKASRLKVLGIGLIHAVGKRVNRDVRDLLDRSDLVLAVGGGYLRAKNPIEAVKTIAAHVPQLPTRPASTVYLPQSIGPLRFGTGGIVTRRLRNARSVHVRDDRSFEALRGNANTRRSPDMALLGLPSQWRADETATPHGGIGIVARALPGDRRATEQYVGRVKSILSLLPDAELLVQASARGNNDIDFYRDALGSRAEFRMLREAVRPGSPYRPSSVISVRLHGAIESIRSGVPAVHASYERKGWGAYGDLGIDEYVHNVYDFSPEQVVEQASALAADPRDYWASVARSIAGLTATRDSLVSELREMARA